MEGYQGLGAEAKLRLLEMRETIHRSLVLKAKLLERGDALRCSDAAVPLTAGDFRDAAGEWLGITSEWVGIASEEPPVAERKVRSNRFLADLAAIRRGESKGDSVWQALQRERGRTRAAKHRAKAKVAAEAKVRLKPRPFTDASDADAAYKARAEAEKSEVMDLDYPPGSWYCNVCWGVVQSDRGEVRLSCNQYVKSRKCTGTYDDDFYSWVARPKESTTAPRSHGRSYTARAQDRVSKALEEDAGWACNRCQAQNMRARAKCFKCSCDRPASEAAEPGAEESLPGRCRKKAKRKKVPRHGWNRRVKGRGAVDAFRSQPTSYDPDSGSDGNHPYERTASVMAAATGLGVFLASKVWRSLERVVDGAADGAIMVVDAVSTQAAELTEWIGTAAKGVVLVCFALAVVECACAVESYDWSWTAKARLFMAGRNPEANVDPRAVPFSQELVAKAARLGTSHGPLIWTNETVAWVGNYVVSLPPGGLAEAPGGKCTCVSSYVTSGVPCKHICLAALEKYKVSTPSHVERAIPAGYPGFPKAKLKPRAQRLRLVGRLTFLSQSTFGSTGHVAIKPFYSMQGVRSDDLALRRLVDQARPRLVPWPGRVIGPFPPLC